MDNSVIEETTLVKGINPIHDLSSPFELTLITYFYPLLVSYLIPWPIYAGKKGR
jgi:hypothetical protein